MHCALDWFQSRVDLFPEKKAVVDAKTNHTWTYKQLNERAERLAQYFIENDIQKGDRIALLASNHISYFDFIFACMKIGSVFVPLNWRLSIDELRYVIQDCSPKLIGIDPQFQGNLTQTEIDNILIEIDNNNYIDRLQTSSTLSEVHEPDETDALAMIYTGGTTGQPKGAVLSHRSILWNAMNTIISWNLTNEDITLTCLPMFHTGGLNALSLPLMLVGGKVVISPEFEASTAVNDLITYECTIVLCVPTMYHMMIRTKAFQQASFPKMKVFLSGGAPCPHDIYKAFREKGIPFKEGYGLTEAGPNNFYIDPADTEQKMGSVGKPMLFNDIKIITEKGGKVGGETVGELLIRGNHSFEYYWNKQEKTDQTIIDGWVHTGDLARQDEEGYVYIVGRKKDMIITGGENVYPLEIEHWLESNDNISEAAVLGLPDDKWGEIVVAFVVPTEKMTETELKIYCENKLTRYKVPRKFLLLEELPKTHVGKINKVVLKEKVMEMN
ncbi:class I adenylate-forming enzyme family protein [Virgibacillus salinus]|uniref:Fatty-acyl-CoA synthase n=1 Tax=Virgibacillus salinus TaxID=553311 RepID=A0A1H1GFC4_9BACI|nr:long-chain-fatty-acid--CoA ligase [Virgibacillus salinus]SDR11795.1 fatty-acyl-CoA synthase [Virgibacillus salinus]